LRLDLAGGDQLIRVLAEGLERSQPASSSGHLPSVSACGLAAHAGRVRLRASIRAPVAGDSEATGDLPRGPLRGRARGCGPAGHGKGGIPNLSEGARERTENALSRIAYSSTRRRHPGIILTSGSEDVNDDDANRCSRTQSFVQLGGTRMAGMR